MNRLLIVSSILAILAIAAGPVAAEPLMAEAPSPLKRAYPADVENTEASFRKETGDLATDTPAAVDFMKSPKIVEVSHLGVIGLSQARRIASIAASKSSDLHVVINPLAEIASSSRAVSERPSRSWPLRVWEYTAKYALGSMTAALVYHQSVSMRNKLPPSQPHHYEIRIKGLLASRWDWLEGWTVSHVEPGETIIRGRVVDDAALHGLLARIRDLNLTLISLRQMDPEDPRKEARDG